MALNLHQYSLADDSVRHRELWGSPNGNGASANSLSLALTMLTVTAWLGYLSSNGWWQSWPSNPCNRCLRQTRFYRITAPSWFGQAQGHAHRPGTGVPI